jgi:hypothetical protein
MYKAEEKASLTNLDPKFLEGMSWVQAIGDKKHADHHWKDGVSVREILDGIKRHTAAIERGEYIDDESKLNHAYHIACGAMYIAHYCRDSERYREFFDQPFGGPPISNFEVGGQRPSGTYATGHPGETVGGNSGVVQESLRPGGTSRRRDIDT